MASVPENALVSTTEADKKNSCVETMNNSWMSSVTLAEHRIPQDHPLLPLRAMADEALLELQHRFSRLYAKTGRPSIAPEKLS